MLSQFLPGLMEWFSGFGTWYRFSLPTVMRIRIGWVMSGHCGVTDSNRDRYGTDAYSCPYYSWHMDFYTFLHFLIFKREFPCLQAGDDSVSFRLSFGLQYIFLLFLPIYDQRTLQNRILSRGMVNDYATMEIRSAGRRMNIPSTDWSQNERHR